jgi:4-diphosphocytidyl-2-C-methyl-D-erythritol kinase
VTDAGGCDLYSRIMNVTASAPAKINIVLGVGPVRSDGYHELATVFHAVDLRDTVTIEPAPAGSGITISVEGADAALVPLDDSNLAARAAALFAQRTGHSADLRIHINKNIPVAGGMAGGSADAAATLVACDALWGARMSRTQLQELGAELGSDIPFAVHGGTMIGQGRGEKLTPVLSTGHLHWVVVPVTGGLSTPAVYSRFDELTTGETVLEPTIDDAVLAALRTDDAKALAPLLRNDLQPAAVSLRPELADVLSEGMRSGALAGIVSGSGPTCVFLAEDHIKASVLRVSLLMRRERSISEPGLAGFPPPGYPGLPAVQVTGPAPGARLEV